MEDRDHPVFYRFEQRHKRTDDVHFVSRPRNQIRKHTLARFFELFVHERDLFVDRNLFVHIQYLFVRILRNHVAKNPLHLLEEIPRIDLLPNAVVFVEGQHALNLRAFEIPLRRIFLLFHKRGQPFEFLIFDEAVDEFLPRVFVIVVVFDFNGKQHTAFNIEKLRRPAVKFRQIAQIGLHGIIKILKILIGDFGNRNIVEIDLILFNKMHEQIHWPLKRI